ncbi:hypothetical protein DPMN_009088 [Dreissena polymorpha]|uniref:WWE domain-containing protein n=1 Tax=Dreissena polymorpha TaxID=45954 RepID=A0A9D4N0I7_DREPO|nr:hypothetical protein DPMN_009088 [Dreissena polymorpha]
MYVPGTQRPVRRTLLSSMSALGQGCIWQWEGDQPGTWNDFDVEQSEYIETCFRTNSRSQVDFQKKFRLPYIIDLAAQTQTRTHTGRVRTIRRWFLTSQYPTEVQQLSSGVKTRSMSPRPGHSASKQFKSTATATLTGASNSTTFMTSTAPSTHLNTHHVYSRTHNSVPVSYTNGIGSSASLGVSSTSGTLPQVNSSVQIALPQVNSSVQSALPQVNSSVQSVLPGPLTRSRVFMHSQTFGAGAGAFNSVGGPHLQTGSSQLQHIGGPHSYQHPSLSSTGPAGAPFQLGSAGSSFSGLFGGAMPTFMTRYSAELFT